MKTKKHPSQIDIKHLFRYCSGNLVYRFVNSNRVKVGDIAGSLDKHGYIQIEINNRRYQLHRLIWIYHNETIPEGMQIDHINHDRSDNRIDNLRLATHSQNLGNQKGSSKKGLPKGVSTQSSSKNPFQARIYINCKNVNLGSFHTPELANAAYAKAAKEHFGEFACS